MRKIGLLIILGIILINISMVHSLESCPTNPPVTYTGEIKYQEKLIEGNYKMKAFMDGKIVSGESEVIDGIYFIDVTPCYGITSGEIKFIINGIEAEEAGNYNSEDWGKTIELDLTLNQLPPQENVCGNGYIDAGEECDDGNNESEDGCSTICAVEYGYKCTGQPSVCSLITNTPETPTNTNTGGGSSSGGGTTTTTSNTNIELSTDIEEEENEETPEETTTQGFLPRMTGAVVGFSKTRVGIGLISAAIIIILGATVIFISWKKKVTKNEE